MDVRIAESWKNHLEDEFSREYFQKLADFVRNEYKTKTVYPPPANIFRAFALCPFDAVKAVILGQDPYHGKGQANGLCFSVNEAVPKPPSLQNIFKELQDDMAIPVPQTGSLDNWARKGVLLLNATLTVVAGNAGSHQHQGWEEFSDAVIKTVSDRKEHIVFILWGRYAQQREIMIDSTKHLILKSAHPSPFSADSGFFGSKPFSKSNEYLKSAGEDPIDWSL